jgi:hypothetical protein
VTFLLIREGTNTKVVNSVQKFPILQKFPTPTRL